MFAGTTIDRHPPWISADSIRAHTKSHAVDCWEVGSFQIPKLPTHARFSFTRHYDSQVQHTAFSPPQSDIESLLHQILEAKRNFIRKDDAWSMEVREAQEYVARLADEQLEIERRAYNSQSYEAETPRFRYATRSHREEFVGTVCDVIPLPKASPDTPNNRTIGMNTRDSQQTIPPEQSRDHAIKQSFVQTLPEADLQPTVPVAKVEERVYKPKIPFPRMPKQQEAKMETISVEVPLECANFIKSAMSNMVQQILEKFKTPEPVKQKDLKQDSKTPATEQTPSKPSTVPVNIINKTPERLLHGIPLENPQLSEKKKASTDTTQTHRPTSSAKTGTRAIADQNTAKSDPTPTLPPEPRKKTSLRPVRPGDQVSLRDSSLKFISNKSRMSWTGPVEVKMVHKFGSLVLMNSKGEELCVNGRKVNRFTEEDKQPPDKHNQPMAETSAI